eukprot:CAMPEP_0204607026 /NCGR_PEP_ID=MMETSP0661-20131031/59445_1 /ASSEMBLY_ACC=CAM_ASM_000606 /TAXON_ID=109239 /ORGANISM="Alexandrium margalefi, Strain AMGDE01CS-322" /LENGTH=130 /DNA_ID=CAMNT_0051618397 /DNA_START=454 /DNA_END=848 /DNA_ORIENTATION=-
MTSRTTLSGAVHRGAGTLGVVEPLVKGLAKLVTHHPLKRLAGAMVLHNLEPILRRAVRGVGVSQHPRELEAMAALRQTGREVSFQLRHWQASAPLPMRRADVDTSMAAKHMGVNKNAILASHSEGPVKIR